MTAAILRDVFVPGVLFGANAPAGPMEDGCLHGDLIFQDGRVVALRPGPKQAPRLVLPALVEAHCHLDKCHTIHRMTGVGGDLQDAIAAQMDDKRHWTADDLRARIGRGLDEARDAGCALLRSHVDWREGDTTPLAWSIMGEAAADRPDIRVDRAALTAIDVLAETDNAAKIARQIAQTGGTLGAFVLDHADRETGVRAVIAAAERFGLALDFHVDEGLDTDLDGLDLIADLILETGFQGPVLCGHCCSLVNVDGDPLARLLDKIARAGLFVTALPTTNLYLQGRRSGTPDRRGLTRLRELSDAGVPIVIASDNVADAFCPTGQHDPMAALNLAVLAGHLDPPFARWIPAVTTDAARALGHQPPYVMGAKATELRISTAGTLPDLISGRQSKLGPLPLDFAETGRA
ncbi:MAG: amidohydrolase family protein [Pseudomonadota bacterium]